MSLAILGAGLVSPAGLTPRAHACVLWASALPPTPSPFLREDGERVPVCYCPWLGARLGMEDRALAMLGTALEDAVRPLPKPLSQGTIPLLLCMPQSRAGLTPGKVAGALAHGSTDGPVSTFAGAASFYEALRQAEAIVDDGAPAVAVGAVDSFISEEALVEHIESPLNPWGPALPPAAEGAAVVVVARAATAARLAVKPLGQIHYAGTAVGLAHDDNDVPADGEAMGSLLRRLPRHHAPATLVFGQFKTDSLRLSEWQLAVARNPHHVDPEYEMRSIESEFGLVGAAAGAMNLVYGLAVVHHGTTDANLTDHPPFLSWAISPDGTRGIAVVSARS